MFCIVSAVGAEASFKKGLEFEIWGGSGTKFEKYEPMAHPERWIVNVMIRGWNLSQIQSGIPECVCNPIKLTR